MATLSETTYNDQLLGLNTLSTGGIPEHFAIALQSIKLIIYIIYNLHTTHFI